MSIPYQELGDVKKTVRTMILDGIAAEREAISYYAFLASYEPNGNDRRTWVHNLNEEKEHLKSLEKKLKKLNG